MKKFIAAGLALLPGFAMAAGDLSYTFVEADYINMDLDPFDENAPLLEDFEDGSGFQVRGSFAVTDNIFLFSNYSNVNSEFTFVENDLVLFSAEQDIKRLDLGGGLNLPVFQNFQNQVDFVARGAYSDIDFNSFDFGQIGGGGINDLTDDSSDGFFIDGSLRTQLTNWLEVSGGIRYTSIQEAESLGISGNAMFEVTPNWGVNLEGNVGDDISQIFLGVRYSFSR